ncbi:MAG TPA: MATE family efflux transporter [Cyclobacteriaceae bacterium]|nr:MATE family efflux transporter [Cyclobacteriaceae bacterium]HMX01456.1 MATE family efflux transporter [Cyclobacteriaceae bacterium]HMX50274.1 MATE family efflux transporter [Cyclobacteriaceae bacterium]HMY92342.1 MATE family efflux transporter [Cyclobacteriaceae bacterium]HNA11546.1 MATE family efflux transporter [Cyclobacteriaceae bacterium]
MSFSTKLTSFFRLLKQAIRGGEENFTEGSIDRAIFLLSVPMVLEMLMESLFAVVDIFFVSRLGDNDAIATIGLTESVLTIIYSLAMGISMGATAMVARRVGEKDIPAAQVAAAQAIYIGIGLSLIISVVGIFFATDILHLMGASESLIVNNSGYTKLMLCGNMTIVMLFIINGVFRGAGNASIAMRSLIISNSLNIALAPVFILVLKMGVQGAAVATMIGRGTGVLYQVYHLTKGNGLIRLNVKNMAVRWDIIGRLIKVSAGGTGQFIIASASWIFLVRIISTFGSAALAGYTIGIRVIVFAIMPAWGMANAAATLVGQNLGAGLPERAEKSVYRSAFLNMIFLGIVTIVFYTLAGPIVGIYTDDPTVLQSGMQCLKIVSLGYVFYAYGMVIIQSFNGAGDTLTPTVLNVFGFWLFQIPFAYLMAIVLDFKTTGAYIAIVSAESAMAIAAIIIFRQGKWKNVKI